MAAQESKTFALKLSTAHDAACPWRNTACDCDLATFPALLADGVQDDFKERLAAFARLNALPPLVESAVQQMCQERRCTTQDSLCNLVCMLGGVAKAGL